MLCHKCRRNDAILTPEKIKKGSELYNHMLHESMICEQCWETRIAYYLPKPPVLLELTTIKSCASLFDTDIYHYWATFENNTATTGITYLGQISVDSDKIVCINIKPATRTRSKLNIYRCNDIEYKKYKNVAVKYIPLPDLNIIEFDDNKGYLAIDKGKNKC